MHLIVGDVHGCLEELLQLMEAADFKLGKDTLVSVGDLVDRGPFVKDVLDLFMGTKSIVVRGNHDDKIRRLMLGRNVTIEDGMHITIDQVVNSPKRDEYLAYLESLPLQLVTDEFVLVHAQPKLLPDRGCMFGDKRAYRGHDIRYNWWEKHNPNMFGGKPVFYGHYWFDEVRQVNNTIGLDTSCVAGKKMSGYILEEKKVVCVPSQTALHATRDKVKQALEEEAWRTDWKENPAT